MMSELSFFFSIVQITSTWVSKEQKIT